MDKELGAKKREFALDVLDNDVFPHCNRKTENVFPGYINELIKTNLGWRKTDDRDSYLNKRIELTNNNNLFRNYFNKW